MIKRELWYSDGRFRKWLTVFINVYAKSKKKVYVVVQVGFTFIMKVLLKKIFCQKFYCCIWLEFFPLVIIINFASNLRIKMKNFTRSILRGLKAICYVNRNKKRNFVIELIGFERVVATPPLIDGTCRVGRFYFLLIITVLIKTH